MIFNEFKAIAGVFFPELTASQYEAFGKLDALYRDWNAKINVVSRKDMDELYRHHVLHSLMIAAYLKYERPDVWEKWCEGGVEVLDLGTGGGFPGVPLAIMFPKVHFTLCDSIGKKVRVADEVSRSVGLENVSVVNARAESLEQDFDWVVSRAVTSLENFLPWVKGKYSEGILYLKGGDLTEEITGAIAHAGLRQNAIRLWSISSLLSDSYFESKYVIEIKR